MYNICRLFGGLSEWTCGGSRVYWEYAMRGQAVQAVMSSSLDRHLDNVFWIPRIARRRRRYVMVIDGRSAGACQLIILCTSFSYLLNVPIFLLVVHSKSAVQSHQVSPYTNSSWSRQVAIVAPVGPARNSNYLSFTSGSNVISQSGESAS
jgi:hypothetical protein